MIDEEKDQTVFIFSTSIALSAFLAQIFLNPEKRNPQQWDLYQSDPGQVPQLPSGLGNLTRFRWAWGDQIYQFPHGTIFGPEMLFFGPN